MELTFRSVRQDEDNVWGAIETILQEAFDDSQYRPNAEFRPLYGDGRDLAELGPPSVFGCFVGRELVAFACIELCPAQNLVYLAYLATSSHWRNQGIGAALIKYVQSIVTREPSQGGPRVVGLLLECEAPRSMDLHSIEMRRIHFYTSLGFRVEPVDFMAPPLASRASEASPYHILTWHVPGVDSSIDIAVAIDWICNGSVLNAPNNFAEECARFSIETIGRDPKLAPEIRAQWGAFLETQS